MGLNKNNNNKSMESGYSFLGGSSMGVEPIEESFSNRGYIKDGKHSKRRRGTTKLIADCNEDRLYVGDKLFMVIVILGLYQAMSSYLNIPSLQIYVHGLMGLLKV